MSVGSRGFRSERAQLVALVGELPKPAQASDMHKKWDALCDKAIDGKKKEDVFHSMIATAVAVSVLCAFGLVMATAAIMWAAWIAAALSVVAIAAFLVYNFAWSHGWKRRRGKIFSVGLDCVEGEGIFHPSTALAKAKDLYNVPVYGTLAEALEDFPMDTTLAQTEG